MGEPQNIMGLKVRKKRMKDQFKDNINVDNNESKVKKKKKKLGSLYICSGGANFAFSRQSYTRIK